MRIDDIKWYITAAQQLRAIQLRVLLSPANVHGNIGAREEDSEVLARQMKQNLVQNPFQIKTYKYLCI